MPAKKQPRPYQTEIVESIREKLRQYSSTIAVVPTGGGKTSIAAWIIDGWEQGNTLFLAHTRELIGQAADRLAEELGYPPVVEMGVRGADPEGIWQGGLCVVGSVQSMCKDRRLEKYAGHPFGLIIVDEAHRATSPMYRKVISFCQEKLPSCKVLGITATPKRADNTSLGIIFDSVACDLSISWMIDDGWLVPIRQEYVILEELNLDGMHTRKDKDFGESDFSSGDLEDMITKEDETLHKMAYAIIEKADDRSTLVFTPGVLSAYKMAEILNGHRPNCAAALDGKSLDGDRVRTVKQFQNGELQFLCNAQLFTEGFDAPCCSCLAMCRPTKSVGRYVQMLGRGLRALPGIVDGQTTAFDRRTAIFTSDKTDCLILDFVGNSSHKLANAWDVLGGNYDVETKELAKSENKGGKPSDVEENLKKAAALLEVEREWAQLSAVAARAGYQSYQVDPFGDGPSPGLHASERQRGSLSDAQLGVLVGLGVPHDDAMKMSKRQASVVIDRIASTRCTDKQGKILKQHGIDPHGVPKDRASRIIDAIASNGWKRPEVLPE